MGKNDEVSVEQIELLPEYREILENLSKKSVIPDNDFWTDQFQYLYRLGLIERFCYHEYPMRITVDLEIPLNAIRLTDKGLLFLARHKKERQDKKKEDRRYWITTFIAVIALGVSLLSVVLQLR